MTKLLQQKRAWGVGGARLGVGLGLGLALAGLTTTSARAQGDDVGPVIDIEVPTVVLDTGGDTGGPAADDEELDLANIVQSAAKGVTTVQEAPAIVTVITSDEIADRQYKSFEQIYDSVPGWFRLGAVYSMFPFPLVRGQIQAVQFMHDGTSLFDPFLNVSPAYRVQPVELIKRVEFITGPGGVLWGSNSLLGILNIITKDADDVDGVEVGGTIGDGNGDRRNARGYIMAGFPDLAGGKVKLFVHSSFETYQGAGFELPLSLYTSPLPQPNTANLYGPLTKADPPRSFMFNFNAKLTFGKLQIRTSIPYIERHNPLGFNGYLVRETLPEDSYVDPDTGMLACPYEEPYFDDRDKCVDKGREARDNEINDIDRYVVAEYRTRLAGGRSGVALKGYGIQFVQHNRPAGLLAPVPALLEGGLGVNVDITSYRAGATLDGDIELPRNIRLLYGTEVFHDWLDDNDTGSRQGSGVQSLFAGPYLLDRLPLPCPRQVNEEGEVVPVPRCPLTFTFSSSRTVLSAYVNPQWRATKKLILDAGARVSAAPGALGKDPYDPAVTFASTAVYGFIPNWHLKFNVTQGFRAPTFNALKSNGEAVQIKGVPGLETETSTAAQAEVNARIFKGERRIRELNFRADYSYTFLENLIQIAGGKSENAGDRGINSAEFLGKLYIQGGHRFELGYTWLRVDTADKGRHRSLPEHWFNLAAVFNVIDDKLSATTNFRVLGAMEDANRIVEYRDYTFDETGNVLNPAGMAEYITVQPTETVLDRLPPAADVTVGLAFFPTSKMVLQATIYNAFNARYYQADAFFDYEPRIEFVPNPYEDFRAYLSAAYKY